MAAGNLEDDNAIVNPMGSALISRFAHFYVTHDHKEWMEWAAGEVDIRITSFLGAFPKHLYTFDADATTPYSCPRTWHLLSNTIADQKIDGSHAKLLSSLLGEGVANEFLSYLKLYKDIISFEDIMRDPSGADISNNMSVRWAVMGVVVHNMTKANALKCAQYLKRFPLELQICALREIKPRYPELLLGELRPWRLELSTTIGK